MKAVSEHGVDESGRQHPEVHPVNTRAPLTNQQCFLLLRDNIASVPLCADRLQTIWEASKRKVRTSGRDTFRMFNLQLLIELALEVQNFFVFNFSPANASAVAVQTCIRKCPCDSN